MNSAKCITFTSPQLSGNYVFAILADLVRRKKGGCDRIRDSIRKTMTTTTLFSTRKTMTRIRTSPSECFFYSWNEFGVVNERRLRRLNSIVVEFWITPRIYSREAKTIVSDESFRTRLLMTLHFTPSASCPLFPFEKVFILINFLETH